MKKVKNKNVYWFFRSMFITLLLVFCLLFLVLGSAECYARITTTITGKTVKVLEQNGRHIFFLGKEIYTQKKQ